MDKSLWSILVLYCATAVSLFLLAVHFWIISKRSPKHLNDLRGFAWVATGNLDGLAKVSIAGESFWLRDCRLMYSPNVYQGLVDNYLLFTEDHGLNYNDLVSFTPSTEDDFKRLEEEEHRRMMEWLDRMEAKLRNGESIENWV